jgi:hypothetical protein
MLGVLASRGWYALPPLAVFALSAGARRRRRVRVRSMA